MNSIFFRKLIKSLHLYRFNQTIFKKRFKCSRDTTMLNDLTIKNFIDIYTCYFYNFVCWCYSYKLTFMSSSHDKF